MNTSPSTSHLNELAEAKSIDARDRALAAIQSLVRAGKRVTFSSVAKEAGVSTTFLYDERHQDIGDAIRRLRELPPKRVAEIAEDATQGKTDTAKDVQIARLQGRVRDLERTVREKDLELERLYGKLADVSKESGRSKRRQSPD